MIPNLHNFGKLSVSGNSKWDKKILFVDRDGTLIKEPLETKQVNGLEQLEFIPNVISSLKKISESGFSLVIVTNQDGLGTPSNPIENFDKVNQKMFEVFASEGIEFQEIFICPHTVGESCKCRKPETGLVDRFLEQGGLDRENSYMIGDRESDLEFAKNIGIKGFMLDSENSWQDITNEILNKSRSSVLRRKTKETDINISWNLDGSGNSKIETGLNFFDHMLENFAKHGNFDLNISCQGDLKVDEHHTIEDVALVLGECFKKSIGDKRGIDRYASERILPMDESKVEVALDISGRPYLVFDAEFSREYVGDFPTEMTEHFFQSFCEKAGINLNLKISGKNTHHMIEVAFKGFGRCLRDAVMRTGNRIPSTKGTL